MLSTTPAAVPWDTPRYPTVLDLSARQLTGRLVGPPEKRLQVCLEGGRVCWDGRLRRLHTAMRLRVLELPSPGALQPSYGGL
jgi:hypothetical protein